METGYVWLDHYAWHNTGNYTGTQPYSHPESPDSKARLASLIEVSGLGEHLVRLPVTAVTTEDVLRVHEAAHVARIAAESALPGGGDAGDGESPFGQGSYEIALLAAGGTVAAVRAVMEGQCRNAYALVRPPGHHAVRDKGLGFCIFANIAIAIEWARANYDLRRIAVVDWDVHHGNGTQDIYYDDADVLAISLHQNGLFPLHSGSVSETGAGGATGTNLNIPLPAGSGNGAYEHAMSTVVVPALRRFRPDLIIVASGFDASAVDPLGRMQVTSEGYRTLTRQVLAAADELCRGRLVMSHEGGYAATYVPFCGLAVLEEMSGHKTGVVDPTAEFYAQVPGHELTSWQAAAIEEAIANVAAVPERA